MTSTPPAVDIRHDRLNLFEFFDHLWSLKWLVVLGVVLGMAIGAWNYFTQPPVITETNAVFYFYTNGTPDFGPTAVADQLVTKLTQEGYEIGTARETTSVVALIASDDQLDRLSRILEDFETLIDSHVDERLAELRQWTQDKVPDAMEPYLRYRSYRDGRVDGTIDLVNYKVVKTDTERQGVVRQMAPPTVVGLLLSLSGCMMLFFVRGWRRARMQEESSGASAP